MYVLTNRIAAMRAEEQQPRSVSIGLRTTRSSRWCIRANQGDCVEITFTNSATGGTYGMHIDGLSYDIGSSGDAIGQNPPSDVAARRHRAPIATTSRTTRPSRARTTCTPAPGNRQAVAHGLFGALVGRAAGLDVPEHRRRARRSSPAGRRRSSPAPASPRSASSCRSTTRSATRTSASRPRTAARCRWSTRSPAPTVRARARSTTAPSRS